MKTYVKITLISQAFALFLLSGCSTNSTPKIPDNLQEAFTQLTLIDDMNKSLRVNAEIPRQEEIYFGSEIHVMIKNASSQQILVRAPEGIKLFIVNDDKWFEINDNNDYFGNGQGAVLYPPGPFELRDRKSTWVRPALKPEIELSNSTSNIILRVLIIGEKISEGKNTGIPVGAYTDVYLTP